MDLKELRDNILRLLWLERDTIVPSYIFEDVTTAINSALQLLWTTPKDYFRKQELTATIAASSDNVTLPDNIQEVVGPLWIGAENDRELQRIEDQSDWNNFWQRFYGVTSAPSSLGNKIHFYFLRERNQSGAESVQVTLEVKPTPTVETVISYLASAEAPSYEVSTINSLSGGEVIGMPHKYVESLLLPIARWMATRSHYFFDTEKIDLIQQDAARALQMLDLSDPTLGTQSSMAKRIQKQTSEAR